MLSPQENDLTIRADEWHVVQDDRDAFVAKLSGQQRTVYRYWERLKLEKGGLPGREEFEPLTIYRALPWLNLVDVVAAGNPDGYRFRQRLIGTALVENFGRDVTGGWYEDIYHPDYLPDHIKPLLEMIRNQRPSLTRIRFPAPDKTHVIYTRLMLPMATDGKNVDLILQVMCFD